MPRVRDFLGFFLAIFLLVKGIRENYTFDIIISLFLIPICTVDLYQNRRKKSD